MKNFIILCTAVFLISSGNLYSADGDRSLLEKLFNKDLPGGVAHKKKEKQENEISSKEVG